MVYVVFNDRWWLCNDTTVKVMTPPPPATREKRRFCYTSANKQIWLCQTCRSLPPNGQDLQPLVRHGMPRAYLLTPRCHPWRWHQVRPPPPSFNRGCIKGWVQEEQAYACPERAYGLLCASHGAGTRCTPRFPNCNTECIKGRGPEHEYACPEHA